MSSITGVGNSTNQQMSAGATGQQKDLHAPNGLDAARPAYAGNSEDAGPSTAAKDPQQSHPGRCTSLKSLRMSDGIIAPLPTVLKICSRVKSLRFHVGKRQGASSDSDPELSSESSPELPKARPKRKRGRPAREQPRQDDLDDDYDPGSTHQVGLTTSCSLYSRYFCHAQLLYSCMPQLWRAISTPCPPQFS